MAKWLYSIGTQLNNMNYLYFMHICSNGHLSIAKWLCSLDLDIHDYKKYAFGKSCGAGHINMAIFFWY